MEDDLRKRAGMEFLSKLHRLPVSSRFSRALYATKHACDLLAPIVQVLYESAHEQVELKNDASAFTIADGLVQEILTTNLFRDGAPFCAIVGEEDSSKVNLKHRPYTVSSLTVPTCLEAAVDSCRASIDATAVELYDGNASQDTALQYKDCTVFIDPIDGTREFSSKRGEQCTILVGFCVDSKPVAGLIYRPLTNPRTWVLGCLQEGLYDTLLDHAHKMVTTSNAPNPEGLLTTNGAISPFTEALLDGLLERHIKNVGDESSHSREDLRVRAGGAGNKVLNMLEGKGLCYIQDRGVSRWDTCAAQAAIEACGGVFAKLAPFVASDGKIESYKYAKTYANLDYEPWLAKARLTKHNVRVPAAFSNEHDLVANDGGALKPYANVQGLLAISSSQNIPLFKSLCLAAAAVAEPIFD